MTDRPPRRSDLLRRSFDRILLIKPSSLGDVIHALPVLHGLRRRYPKAQIDWLISSSFAPLLHEHPDLNELITFERGRYGRMGWNPSIAAEFLYFLRDLRKRRYDLVVDLQGLFRSGLLTWATGSPVRIGFADAREGAWAFYTDRLPSAPPDTHAVDRNYSVADTLGFGDVPIRFDIPIRHIARQAVLSMLEAEGWANGQQLVAIAPGARWETKLWSAENFSTIIDWLCQHGLRPLLIGGNNEASLCTRISQTCTHTPINLAGRTSIPELVAAIALSDLVVCLDSAAVHMATALNRPLVCLVGPTNPNRTGPYRRRGDVVRHCVDCSPCYYRKLSQCPYDHRCMRDLSTDIVISELNRRLNGGLLLTGGIQTVNSQ